MASTRDRLRKLNMENIDETPNVPTYSEEIVTNLEKEDKPKEVKPREPKPEKKPLLLATHNQKKINRMNLALTDKALENVKKYVAKGNYRSVNDFMNELLENLDRFI